ncbi:MAG: alkaline phosphatase family protein [Bifidobacteriaceae bacterium]|nr:alkaline phosphatase family protein [Bifidobacteriaceae bacterium]
MPIPSAIAAPVLPGWAVPPRFTGPCLASLLPVAARAAGIDLGPMPGTPDRAPVTLPGRTGTELDSVKARCVIVVLADGLGFHNLAERAGHTRFLRRQATAQWVTGFPSTTVASLATFGTGLAPGRTGMAGYALRDPVTGRRAVLINWDTPTPAERWQPEPTLFDAMVRAGRPGTFIGQARFEHSPLSRATLRGSSFVAAEKPKERVSAAVRAAKAGGVVYLYWGELDKAGHRAGWRSAQWLRALENFDSAMAALAAAAPSGTEIWITADHGMVDVSGGPEWDVAKVPELAEGVAVVAGEPRTLDLYVEGVGPEARVFDDPARIPAWDGPALDPAATAEAAGAVAARWRGVLGDQAWVLTRDEAIAAGLFGDVTGRVRPLLGDVVVAMAGNASVVDTRIKPPKTVSGHPAGPMIGHHGSLTAPEMHIPLIRVAA